MRGSRRTRLRPDSTPVAIALFAAAALLAAAAPAAAQDSHYWSQPNGARATLLGGMVVASERDLSAGFYNPAALARVTDDNALSMFSQIETRLRIDIDTSGGMEATSKMGSSAPGFFAARIPFLHLVEGDVVTFSYLARESAEVDLSGQALTSGTVPTQAAGISLFQDIYDGWFGVSWAKGGESFAAGASLFYSGVSYRQRIRARAVSLSGPGEALAMEDELYFKFSVWRLMAKLGVTWSWDWLDLGATVTLPSVRLPRKSGTVSVAHTAVSTDPSMAPELTQTREEGLSADYRSPVSLALGASFYLGPVELMSTAEWFGSVSGYEVLNTRSFQSQLPATQARVEISQSRDAVLNYGVGFSWAVMDFLSFFGSGRTDRSYRPDDSSSFVGLGGYDLTHLTAGVGVSRERVEIWLGGLYAYGDSRGESAPSPLPSAPVSPSATEFDAVGVVAAFQVAF